MVVPLRKVSGDKKSKPNTNLVWSHNEGQWNIIKWRNREDGHMFCTVAFDLHHYVI